MFIFNSIQKLAGFNAQPFLFKFHMTHQFHWCHRCHGSRRVHRTLHQASQLPRCKALRWGVGLLGYHLGNKWNHEVWGRIWLGSQQTVGQYSGCSVWSPMQGGWSWKRSTYRRNTVRQLENLFCAHNHWLDLAHFQLHLERLHNDRWVLGQRSQRRIGRPICCCHAGIFFYMWQQI